MRALCGAIITAGALIGLGLTALGIGTRYQFERTPTQVVDGQTVVQPLLVQISQMDRPLIFALVFLTCLAIIGLGIAFVGLAYHHHHRHHELLAAGHIPHDHAYRNEPHVSSRLDTGDARAAREVTSAPLTTKPADESLRA
jgi:hypothetical protein